MSDVQANDESAYLPNGRVAAFAQAIARAEGFYVPGSIPALAHNPGDLVVRGWEGSKMGAEGIAVFASDDEGWRRLYRQLEIIIEGKSAYYTLDDTIATMGSKWAPGDGGNWARNVAGALGVDVDTHLRDVLGVAT